MGYSKQVFQKASEELKRRRILAEELTSARKREIAAKIPQAAAIQSKLADTGMSVTRVVLAAPKNAREQIDALKKENLALQEELAALLENAGYPRDYLKGQKACEICGGTGYEGMKMCSCFSDILRKEAYAGLSKVSPAKSSTFDNFSLSMFPEDDSSGVRPREHMAAVLNACKKYADEFTRESPSLLMQGNTGLGKTHLTLAIAGEAVKKGYGVVYTPVQKLMDKLESEKFSYSAEAKERYANDIENVLYCDLLVLDDLGAEFITQFSSSALYNIVNSRLVEGMPTIISTNLEPSEIEYKYSQRMLSRLMGGYRVMKFFGKDIRFVKKMRQ